MKSFIILLSFLLATVTFTVTFTATNDVVTKDWTIAVFLNGDNNLDYYGDLDIAEMQAVGSTTKMNIVVMRDTSKAATSTKILYIEKGKSTPVYDYGKNMDMGDWNNLVGFFQYIKENYPAKNYMIDIWNHGAGWIRSNTLPLRGISYDDNSGNHITTPQLGQAMEAIKQINDGKNIAILGMDACLMQMIEIEYEIKDSVDYVAASEETEPGKGWPYDNFLAPLAKSKRMLAKDLAGTLTREYVNSYTNGSQGPSSVQFSTIELKTMAKAISDLNIWTDYIITNFDSFKTQLKTAQSKAQKYAYSNNKDLIHFINLAMQSISDEQFKILSSNLLNSIQLSVIENKYNGSSLQNSKGIAVWIPSKYSYSGSKKAYQELKWGKDSSWVKFLDKISTL